jgi:hypothetical protein
MFERRSSIHSTNGDDDEQLLALTSASEQRHERILLTTVDEPIVGIISTDEKESDTEFLLDETEVEPHITRTALCSNAPARYVTAIWAFFGFFCLYAMRVNLSVAVVAMVSSLMI